MTISELLYRLLEKDEFTNALLLLIIAMLGAATRFFQKQWKETKSVRKEILKRLDIRSDPREEGESDAKE